MLDRKLICEPPCDRPTPLGPSEEVAWADAAASNPETETRTSNHRALLGWTGQWQVVRAPGILKEGETPAEGCVEEGGVMEEEDGRRQQRAVLTP
ncbi:hypothetical protein NDU88_006268 [Pleurodeles waltl]|uniref:Uncharacterized protein n=1 Tax=Pleurodeles waltl TaxID=8319 RepID=A0AAV7X0T2_PLEWA|nr:hypothetical protein NDU88_006268 [Pleurodeles waltl]